MGIFIWLMFENWARVGESRKLAARSVIPASRPQSHSELHGYTTTKVAIILNNSLDDTPGETGYFDHMVTLDLVRHRRLSIVFLHLIESTDPLSQRFPLTYAEVRPHSIAAVQALGLVSSLLGREGFNAASARASSNRFERVSLAQQLRREFRKAISSASRLVHKVAVDLFAGVWLVGAA